MSEKITPGQLANLIGDAIADDADSKELAKIINEKFLFGFWADESQPLRERCPCFLKDIRGVIVAAYKVGFERGVESEKELRVWNERSSRNA